MGRIGLVYDDVCLGHDQGMGHPEQPSRLRAVSEALSESGVDFIPLEVSPTRAADLERVHTADHIATMVRACRDSLDYPDPDVRVISESWDAALFAAGAGIAACSAVLEGKVDQAFCAVRPPGHHAESDRAMGFCLFNNIVIAARWLREVGDVDRVAILDWDVHHGNGSQHSTYDDDSIYYMSLHQYPFYPGTGRPSERGKNDTNLNVCMQIAGFRGRPVRGDGKGLAIRVHLVHRKRLAKVDLKRNDVVVAIDGKRTPMNSGQITQYLLGKKPGAEIEITRVRPGQDGEKTLRWKVN